MFHPPGPRAHDRQLWRRGGGSELVTPGPGNQKAHFHVTRPPLPTPPPQHEWVPGCCCRHPGPLSSRWQSPGASLPP